jgi:hypothetical protein
MLPAAETVFDAFSYGPVRPDAPAEHVHVDRTGDGEPPRPD